MFHIFILAIRFCLILSFCTQFYFFFSFAKSYKGAVKCAHSALSKNSVVSLQHCQKNDLPLPYLGIIGPHTEWNESLPSNGVVLQESASACRLRGRPAQRLPCHHHPQCLLFCRPLIRDWGSIDSSLAPGPVASKIHLVSSFKYHL